MDDETRCASTPEVSFSGYASLAPPVCRASTIAFADADAYGARFERGADGYVYGLYGTPTHRFLEKKITALEQGSRTLLTPSGQAAVALTLQTLLRCGDTVLIPDSVYPPVRDFAGHELERAGIRAVFYDPCDLAALERLIDDKTKLVWVESPGSTTMEIQDLPVIIDLAQARGVLVGCDNSWATPLYCKPLALGADIVVEALSKYISGHSDILMGSITTRDNDLALAMKAALGRMGIGTSPDDCSLVLRGIETLAVRLERSAKTAARLAQWIETQALTERVLHPALSDCPGHELWLRDFQGASGVFSVVLKSDAVPHVQAALNGLSCFSIGASWGGTRSLMVPMKVHAHRSATAWAGPDLVLRISVGMESEAALLEDLKQFFGQLAGAMDGAIGA